jgi:hypothetical protein
VDVLSYDKNTQEQSMTFLRLGVHQLPTAQAGLVRALMQLLSKGSNEFRWTFAQEAPYDALIVHAESPDIADPELLRKAHALSALVEPHCAAPPQLEALPWPLQADRLESWLTRVQRTLGVPEHLPASLQPQAPGEPGYRLKRWPPDALLHGDVKRVRLATLLSRRHLAISELSQVSGQETERCRTFLQLLQNFDLLDIQQATPVQRSPATSSAPSVSPIRHSLISSIRRRLGL